MASSELKLLIEAQQALIAAFGAADTPDAARRVTRDHFLEDGAGTVPSDVVITPVDAGGVPAESVRPPGAIEGRTILYLHGGGYLTGSPEEARETVARIGRAAFASVLSVAYRLAPENAFPAAVDDAVAAYRWLLATGVRLPETVLLGESAGGGLVLALLLASRDAGIPLPAGAVALSPLTDLAATGATLASNADRDPLVSRALVENMAAAYLQGTDAKTPLASPLYGDLTGLPPLLIQVGEAEALLDDARRLADNARAAGVDVAYEAWDEMLHMWQFYGFLPEATAATDRIGAFIRDRTKAAVNV